jgi:putative phage-type endonuclease
MRQTHNLVQGTEAWHQYRATHLNASDAPAMMGVSPYKTRAQLVKEYATGISQEVTGEMQRRFDEGHSTENAARALIEEQIGEELYPVVMSYEADGLKLSASLDGMTIDGSTIFEHKLANATNVPQVEAGQVPDQYRWQLTQQLLVSGAEKCIFAVSKGTEETLRLCEFTLDQSDVAKLLAGWKQFLADVQAYQPETPKAAPKIEAIKDLPALVVDIAGTVKSSNLAVYRARADDFLATIKTDLVTDDDFANAENMVKFCDRVEKELKTAKKQAQSQAAEIDELFRTIDEIAEGFRQKRLTLEKNVSAKKDALKIDIMRGAQKKLDEFLAGINAEFGKPFVSVAADFAGAGKGKKSLAGLQDAVDSELSNAKIAATERAATVRANLKLIEEAKRPDLLDHDIIVLANKVTSDLADTIAARIAKAEAVAKAAAVTAGVATVSAVAVGSGGGLSGAATSIKAPNPFEDDEDVISAIVARVRELPKKQQLEVLNFALSLRKAA